MQYKIPTRIDIGHICVEFESSYEDAWGPFGAKSIGEVVINTYGRLNVVSSTQIVFHRRRSLANALHIPKSMIRVSKTEDRRRSLGQSRLPSVKSTRHM